jgi:hypothetical protein
MLRAASIKKKFPSGIPAYGAKFPELMLFF